MSPEDEPVAYEFEVKGPASREWVTHYVSADEVDGDPAELWRDDNEVRNVRPLVYAEEGGTDE